MSYQALARKWRPRTFSELVGQAHVVSALSNALDENRVHHAFLFTGTRGVGKTTVARILARCLNCEGGVSSRPCGECASCTEIDEGRHVDLIEVDAASRAKVDETRELMNNVQFAPTRARHKIYLIDEVHMFSDASFNALLKTLEEPPEHVKFLLATTDPQRMPITVLSRCLQFSLKRLPVEQIVTRMAEVLESESVPAEPAALRMLARAADGSLRDALSLLDQAIVHGGGRLQADTVRAMLGLMDRRHVRGLMSHLASGDGAALLAQVEAMAGDVADYGETLGELLAELKAVAVAQLVPEAHTGAEDEDLEFQSEMAGRIPAEDVQLFYQIGLIGRRDLPLAPDPRSGFEMTLLRMLAFQPAPASGSPRQHADAEPAARAGTSRGGDAPADATTRSAAEVSGVPAAERAPAGPGAAAAHSFDWLTLARELPLSGMARELAMNCQCVERGDGKIRLRVSSRHGALASGRPRERLAQALNDALGHEVRLVLEVAEPDEATPAQLAEQEAQQRLREAEQALQRDPGVRAIVDAFDARIDTGSVRPSR